MQKNKGWRRGSCENGRTIFIAAKRRQSCGRSSVQRCQGESGAVDDGDGNKLCDLAPALPAIEITEIVSAYDPDKMDAWAAFFQVGNCLETKVCADCGLDGGDFDARMICHVACSLKTLGEGCHLARIFQRIVWSDEPPDAIEAQPLEGQKACRSMPAMWRIETAAEQANSEARREWRVFMRSSSAMSRHCERSEAIHWRTGAPGLLRRCASRNDGLHHRSRVHKSWHFMKRISRADLASAMYVVFEGC
jgi:hypothetical protein